MRFVIRLKALYLITVFLLIGCTIQTDIEIEMGNHTETKKLHSLLEREWEKGMVENPEWATQLGDARFNNILNDVSHKTIVKKRNDTKAIFKSLSEIDRSELSDDDKLNYDLYLDGLKSDIEGEKFLAYLMPINQMGGIQISFAGISNYMPFKSIQDYENYIERMKAFPLKVEQTIDLMKRGVESGWVPPRVTLKAVPDQIKSQFENPIDESPLFKPFKDFPKTISKKRKEQLKDEMRAALTTVVYPSYRSLFSYFTDIYLDECRESIACKEFPMGGEYYNYQIKTYTTTDLTAEEIHQIGLDEVKRIRAEMDSIIDSVGFEGTFDEFLTFLRTDQRFYFTDEEDLLNAYRVICKKADAQLPKFFGKLPRLPYGVRAMPDYQAPGSPTAYYYPGSNKAQRSGFFMANTYKLETRPKYEMEALSIHEAVPGHHLQISLAQELEGIPTFRKHSGYTAFVEGWGLYSEKLAEEMGFYDDPFNKFGQLTYEMWRACRLVVDTGMHAFDWTRQEAIDFMLSNTAKTKNDVTVEIDRYIAWPGQALAYKIGELKIRELRAKAEKQMGRDFDIRKFHDVVLGQGAVPLNILENQVNDYIQSKD